MKLFIVPHHSDDPTQGPQFEKVNAYHRSKGFPRSSMGFFCGYHYFIGYNGEVKQARQESEVGAHSNSGVCAAQGTYADMICRDEKITLKDKFMNYSGIGICLAGDFTKHAPNPAQIVALEALVTDIQKRWGIPDQGILLHRECKPTACPGIDLRALLMRERSQKMQQPATVKAMLSRVLARRMKRQENN